MENKKFNTRKGSNNNSYRKSNNRYKKSSVKKDDRFGSSSNHYNKSKSKKRDYKSQDGESKPYRKSSGGNSGNYKKKYGGFDKSKSSGGGSRGGYGGRSSGGSRGGRGGYGGRRQKGPKSIDITTFIEKAQKESVNQKTFQIVNSFEDFAFDEKVKNNLRRMGFITPTPIQDGSIVHIMAGEDVIGLANTGTGKTGAFLLPLISKVLKDPREQVLIIAPTRELVLQIDNEFRNFAQGTKLKSATVIGGVSAHKQIHNLLRKPSFIIGTPGRLKDLSERKALKLKFVSNIVLDEVDRMLDMGFINDIKSLLIQTRDDKQSLFFSATMPDAIKKLTNEFLNNPIVVERQAGRTVASVSQEVLNVGDSTAKFNELKRILQEDKTAKVLVFSETRRSVEKLTKLLYKLGIRVDSIHGDKSQYQRQKALSNFKEGKVAVLIATDVAARGLDIKGVNIVINYTVPQTYDDYVHRIGRTGRASAKGRAITFVAK